MDIFQLTWIYFLRVVSWHLKYSGHEYSTWCWLQIMLQISTEDGLFLAKQIFKNSFFGE
jgi:hypothetical protein